MLGKALLTAATGMMAEEGPLGVEDVFSTYLYTGNGSTQTITNGIDLAGEGGLVWAKVRNSTISHNFIDTIRGGNKSVRSDLTSGELTDANLVTSFNSDGFSIGSSVQVNQSPRPYASWTFRKAPKFFDVVTYTGDGVSGRAIAHNLGSTPGCVIIKRLDSAADWFVWHRSSASNTGGLLNSTDSFASNYNFADSAPSSTSFFVKNPTYDSGGTNANGGTYVAYLFAHDAGGFGDSGNDSVIKCGSYTGNGSTTGPVIDLGWEPQWLLVKNATSAPFQWCLYDNMRGIPTDGKDSVLFPNSTSIESIANDEVDLTPNGFKITSTNGRVNGSGDDIIYIAIRRGPMKTPTAGTDVFEAVLNTGTGSAGLSSRGTKPLDLLIYADRDALSQNYASYAAYTLDRLRGDNLYLRTSQTSSEGGAGLGSFNFDVSNAGYVLDGSINTSFYNANGVDYVSWMFRRAPGFFDVVAYAGDGTIGRTISHGLGVTPELIISKVRSTANSWYVFAPNLLTPSKALFLNLTIAASNDTSINNTAPTSSVFTVGSTTSVGMNATNANYITYLFATVPGVSKVGSYTGTGATLDIDCGFTNGARFVLIKRTDANGNWRVWDTARGIVSGNDPLLNLNLTNAEDLSTDWIDPLSSGFQLSGGTNLENQSGGSYIFLAIA